MIIFIVLLLSSFCFAQEIEVPDVIITGEDKSPPSPGERGEREEKLTLPTFEPHLPHPKLRLPTQKLLFEPKGALPEIIIKEKEEKRLVEPSPPTTSSNFTISYGTLETLSYKYTHALQTENKSYLLAIQRMNSKGFKRWKRIFDRISKDELQANLNFPLAEERVSVSTKLSYFDKRLLLPYKYEGRVDVRENAKLLDFSLCAHASLSPAYELKGRLYCAYSSLSHEHSQESKKERDKILETNLRLDTYWLGRIPFSIAFNGYSSSRKKGLIGFFAESKGIEMSSLSINLRGGITFIRDEGNRLFPDYSLSMSYPVGKLALRACVRSNLEDPLFPSLYAFRDYVKVNDSLKAEKTNWWAEFFGEYLLHQNSSLGISLFYKKVEDMIYWKEEDDHLLSLSNADTELRGFRISVKYFLSENLSQTVLLNYINTDKVIPYLPEYKLETGIKYLGDGGLRVELLLKYFGEQYPFYGERRDALSSYLTLDANVSKKLGKWITLSLSGKNLLDEVAKRRKAYPVVDREIEGGITLKF